MFYTDIKNMFCSILKQSNSVMLSKIECEFSLYDSSVIPEDVAITSIPV